MFIINYKREEAFLTMLLTLLIGCLGIPDVDDAKKSVKSLLNGNRETQPLMKQQIISNRIQNFNCSIQDFKINEATLNKIIKFFILFEKRNAKLKVTINSHLTLLMKLLEDLNEKYDSLISAMTLAKHNIYIQRP